MFLFVEILNQSERRKQIRLVLTADFWLRWERKNFMGLVINISAVRMKFNINFG